VQLNLFYQTPSQGFCQIIAPGSLRSPLLAPSIQPRINILARPIRHLPLAAVARVPNLLPARKSHLSSGRFSLWKTPYVSLSVFATVCMPRFVPRADGLLHTTHVNVGRISPK
jgi:hypothetical protein